METRLFRRNGAWIDIMLLCGNTVVKAAGVLE